jgi:CDP-diacylglycerol---serine O-phosphatidyltransferase
MVSSPDSPAQDELDSAEGARRSRGVYILPNLFTTGTLFAGFYAIVAAIDGNFSRAGIAVFIAMLCDGLDGRVARWTNTQSDFGKQYDSLSDMVAFGLAPAIVVYQWGVERIAEYGRIWGRLGWLAAFFYAVAAALRLARFNTRTAEVDKRYFEGLPSPSAAATVAGFIWLVSDTDFAGWPGLVLAFLLTVLIGALMVSRFSYWSGKDMNLRGRVPWAYAAVIPLIYVVISASPPQTLFALFGIYALSAPMFWVWRKLRRRSREAS